VERLGREIKQELSRFGPQGGMPEVLAAWPDAVGPMVAANAWPARIARDGTLHVNTSSSTWAFELGQLAPAILAELQHALGKGVPKALKFVPGHLPEPAGDEAAEARTEVPEPTAETLQKAASIAAEIEDENLRKLVEKAVALGLSRDPSDHRF
jgi:hypothetical protein